MGVLAAVVIVPAALAASSFPRGQKSLGLDATFSTALTGELSLRSGVLTRDRDLRAGDTIRGSRLVRNQTGRVLIVSVRALPSTRDADALLRTRLLVDGKPLFEGTLGELRTWTEHWFQLKRGERRSFQMIVDLPADAGPAYPGVVVDVPVELKAVPRHR